MSRDRSGLAIIQPEPDRPGCSPDEVAARRQKVQDARQKRHEEAYGAEIVAPIFSDWRITTLADVNRLCAEMIIGIESGDAFSVRVRKV